jgi:hypothetical protein
MMKCASKDVNILLQKHWKHMCLEREDFFNKKYKHAHTDNVDLSDRYFSTSMLYIKLFFFHQKNSTIEFPSLFFFFFFFL